MVASMRRTILIRAILGLAILASNGVPIASTAQIRADTEAGTLHPAAGTVHRGGHDMATAPSPEAAPAPSLEGIAPIPSNFRRTDEIVRNDRVQPSDQGPIGAFRLICQPGRLNWDDPIVYPGVTGGSPHLHQWFGNDRADAHSTYASLRAAGESSCMGPLNRSAYWMPAMIAGETAAVRPDYLMVYYKRYPRTAPECTEIAEACIALPHGLRYVFGFDMQEMDRPQPDVERHLAWKCVTPENTQRGETAGDFSRLSCFPGDLLIATLAAPDCWNGRTLDSPDHRSHMAYPRYDGTSADPRCPRTHPYLIPQFTLGATWKLRPGDVLGDWHLASDRMPGMPQLPAGRSFHSDWFGAWDPETMAAWTANCIDRRLSCVDGELGNGTAMKRPDDFGYVASNRIVPIPARPDNSASHEGH